MAAARVILSVGTKKGLFLFTSRSRKRWQLGGPFHWQGSEVDHALCDPRTGVVYATANSPFFGCQVIWSKDLGESWQAAKGSPKFTPGSGLKVERIWHIEPGAADQPEVLYAGVAPAALFRSEDCGQAWQEVTGLSAHPTRDRWQPGAGGLCLHSILLDPSRRDRMFVAISSVGTFRTDDDGQSWGPLNRGVRQEFGPERYPEFGQCVHKLIMAPGRPSLLFQQNHCGVYRSDDAGETWQEITAGLPSDFGFPMAIHPREPETIYVVPLESWEAKAPFRCPPEGKLRVFRSRDGGKAWEPLSRGLPQRNAFMGVYREGLTIDSLEPAGLYLGTNTGKLFFSDDEGDSWRLLADNLPPIASVSATVLG